MLHKGGEERDGKEHFLGFGPENVYGRQNSSHKTVLRCIDIISVQRWEKLLRQTWTYADRR